MTRLPWRADRGELAAADGGAGHPVPPELEIAIDRDSPMPVYVQIKRQIEAAIRAGLLQPGDGLPSEPELALHLGVSKMTVRQAFSQLVAEGLVERHRGRGTFVCAPKVEIQLPYFTSFTQDMLARGFTPRTEILAVERTLASGRQAAALGVEPHAPLIRLVRLRLADERPMALETTWLRADLVPGFLERHPRFVSLYQVLEEDYGIRPTRARQTLEAAAATPGEAAQLGLPPGAPVLLLESLLFDQHDRPVEMTKAVYRGDRYRLYFERVRGGP